MGVRNSTGSGTLVNDTHLGGFCLEPSGVDSGAVSDSDGLKGRAHSNLELLGKWRVLPFHLSLAQRRFGWLQCMVQFPQHNEQVVAALFGRLEVSGDCWKASLSALGSDGKLSDEYCSPLTQAFVYAIEVYRGISGTEVFFEHWARYDDSLKALFLSKPLGKDFCLVDSALLQAAFFADQSWGLQSAKQCNFAERGDDVWECGLARTDGSVCAASFKTRNQLVAHQTKTHSEAHAITSCVCTNSCPNCATRFSALAIAKQHLMAAYSTGACKLDCSYHKWPIFELQLLDCHHCETTFDSTEALVAHYRRHLPQPTPLLLPQLSSVSHARTRRRRRRFLCSKWFGRRRRGVERTKKTQQR